ncbi:MAG: FAD-dependent oxidoreductase [Casimicrobiaceae bacterium]
MRSVVIAGASLAGFSAAQALRKRGFDGTITVVGEEPHLPYQRPPLSKQFLCGEWERPRLDLRIADGLQLEWILNARAIALDMHHREVVLADGRRLRFDGLVVATGAHACRPGWCVKLDGVFTLRTVDDAQALRSHLASGTRKVVIVGAGFIGSEAAASLRKLGHDVTLADIDSVPMRRVLGERLGGVCLRLHESHGVNPLFGVAVDAILGSTSVERVRLRDGRTIETDCVIVGVGVTPNVEWLRGSGLVLDDGVVCDSACAALGAERVVAAGDVASWAHPHYGQLRVEHWDNAIAQGDAAARTLLAPPGTRQPYAPVPFFWSDQYDCKLQLIGSPRPGDTMRVVEGALDDRRFVATFERDSQPTGAFLFNSMHRIAAYRQAVESAAAGLMAGADT